MKKGLIILSIVLVLIIGIGCFIFIPNGFAMTTIFSQNEEKIQEVINNAIDKINNHDYYDLSLSEEDTRALGGYYSFFVANIKLKKVADEEDERDGFEFYGTVTKTTQATEDSEKVIENSNVCFKDGVLYIHILKSESTEEVKIKYEEDTWESAFELATGISPHGIFPFDSEFKEHIFNNSEFNSSMFLGSKPSMFGQKYLITINDTSPEEGEERSSTFYIDLFGKLKQFKYNHTSQIYSSPSLSITYNNFNKVTVTSPTDHYELIIED